MRHSNYPLNDTGYWDENVYQEELDTQQFLAESVYEFADFAVEQTHRWPVWMTKGWREHAVPFSYIYQDYRRWCSRVRQDYVNYLEGPGVMTFAQLSVALRKAGIIEWDTPKLIKEHYGWSRRVTRKRRCNRRGTIRSMVMYRGIKHPDGYILHDIPGRPSRETLIDL